MDAADLESRKRRSRDEAGSDDDTPKINQKKKPKKSGNNYNDDNMEDKDDGPQDPEYQEIQGDLFLCPEEAALAHCVSSDLRMGKGIAVDFKRKFGKVPDLINQNKVVGEVALLKHKDRFVYYLVTKERYWNKPTYQTLTSSLEQMRDHAVNNGVKMICMPKIGCGLDKLEWYKVRWNLKQTFKGTGIKLCVYSYDPNQ